MSAMDDGTLLRLRYRHGSATFGKCSLPETSTGWIVLNEDPAHVDASPAAAQCILLRLWHYTETFLVRNTTWRVSGTDPWNEVKRRSSEGRRGRARYAPDGRSPRNSPERIATVSGFISAGG